MNYTHDGNFLRCSHCGKYRVDSLEDFEINYKEDGSKEWLCAECNKFKRLFKERFYGTTLEIIIAPVEGKDDCKVYNKEMYI